MINLFIIIISKNIKLYSSLRAQLTFVCYHLSAAAMKHEYRSSACFVAILQNYGIQLDTGNEKALLYE